MRSNDMLRASDAEKEIYNAIKEVDKLWADPRLTTVVVMLSDAKRNLSEVLDEKYGKE